MTEINADNVPAIMRELRRPRRALSCLILRGCPADRMGGSGRRQARFTVRIYGATNQDIVETVMHEQPYSHFLGCYDGSVAAADLESDIADMIASKYGVVA